MNLKVKMSQSEFLRSALSGKVVTGTTRSEQGSFSKFLRSFKAGSLKNIQAKRTKKRGYVVIEDKLIGAIFETARGKI